MDITDDQLMKRVMNLENELKDTLTQVNSILKKNVEFEDDSVFSFLKKLHAIGLITRAESYIQRKYNVSYEIAVAYVIQFIEGYPSMEKKKEESEVVHKKPPSKSLQVWNSFLKVVRTELEMNGSNVSYDDVVKKAREMKESDQDSYKLFAENWTPDT
jgi:DNA repair ATPase RecN